MVEMYSGRDVIVVAHGSTIRAVLALALDLKHEAALAFTIENCSITRIDHIEGPGMGSLLAHRHGQSPSAVSSRRPSAVDDAPHHACKCTWGS